MMFQEDEHGRLVRIPDPGAETMKKMRELEAENAKAMAERDAELAAKQAAFERAKKEDERRRALQVEKAQREVAAIFRANKERELADRLSREAAERERFKRIAIETREKIEEDNRRQREAERLAEQHLKQAKEVPRVRSEAHRSSAPSLCRSGCDMPADVARAAGACLVGRVRGGARGARAARFDGAAQGAQ